MKAEIKTVQIPERLGVVLFNAGMFGAIGESDKPIIIIDLTPQQREQIEKQYNNGYSVLSIHLIEK